MGKIDLFIGFIVKQLKSHVICHEVIVQFTLVIRQKTTQLAIDTLLARIIVEFLKITTLLLAIASYLFGFSVSLWVMNFLHVTVQAILEGSGKVAIPTFVALDSQMHILMFIYPSREGS